MGRRRQIAAFLLSKNLPIRPSERRMRRELRPILHSYLGALRSTAKQSDDRSLRRKFQSHSNDLKKGVAPVLRRGSVYEAQASYNDTVKELKRLGEEAERRDLTAGQRREVLKEADALIKRRFEPLPERMLNRLADLRSDRGLRPLSQGLADELARDAATLARVQGERIANEEQGTGYWSWVTVGDKDVRRSHRKANRERRRIGTLFSTRCRYARDPTGPAEETYGCRCHMRPVKAPRGG